MKTLDADENPLVDSTGKRMARDIVQFVCFRETNHSSYVLAKEVLDEIPREISNFFKMKRIVPNPKAEMNDLDFDSFMKEEI